MSDVDLQRAEPNDRHGQSAVGEIVIRGLSKKFPSGQGEITAFQDINLTIRQGEFLCIVGPSGCGKSTLLRILAGLDAPTAGTIEVTLDHAGRPIDSMVFQEHGTFPWLTVEDNVAYGLKVRGVPRATRRERAAQVVERVGLKKFARAYPHQLSGGMRQRVNIARAFCNDPSVLYMDEPMASLDEQTKMILQGDLIHLWEGTGRTVVFITHNLDEAVLLGDRVVVMTKHPGRLKAVIDVELSRPRDVIELRNSLDFLEVRQAVWDQLRSEFIDLTEGER